MKTVGIVYYSKNGATETIAQYIAEGAQSEGAKVVAVAIKEEDIHGGRYTNEASFDQLAQCDAILFGSPTYMGSASAQFKSFMDKSSDAYVERMWDGKLAAGFTTGGSINGEQQQTLLSFFTLACQHGMVWAGLNSSQFTDQRKLNRTGSSIGLVASPENDQIHPNDLQTATYFGQRIARLMTEEKDDD
ncbi:flavodoxin family protein [Vibrio sonorensis]|uniref:flavodoxin family protein n=1 Tax=Vibrio sonorensis TaxID=1004316 RepID=UPI0008DA7432|nr:flavodoxin family protein [Vibrio sonorensis]